MPTGFKSVAKTWSVTGFPIASATSVNAMTSE
jgi:hypothetical protein